MLNKRIQIALVGAVSQLFWIPSALGSELEVAEASAGAEGPLVLLGLLAIAFFRSSGKNPGHTRGTASLDQTLFN
jgi:hypothetical protein